MKSYFLLLLMLASLYAYAQETESSLTVNIDTAAGTVVIQTEVVYESGARAIYRTDTLNREEAASRLRTIHHRGGNIGLADYSGQRQLTEAYRKVIQANRIDREHADLRRAWEEITGQEWGQASIEYDTDYLGDWTLTTPDIDGGLQVTIFRNNNGRLRAQTDLAGTGRVEIDDKDRITIRGLEGLPTLILTKRNPRRQVLFSADRTYRISKK
jgi:hypothetical protein